jgi:uncharacterized membrane protein
MSWALLFRARQYLKGSLWFYPLAGAILGPLLAVLTRQADTSVTVPPGWQYTPSTASTVLTTIVGATVGLTGFVVTVTVLAIQMATGTFSARYMRIWYRDGLLQATLTVLVGTAAFAFSLIRQVTSTAAPNIGVSVAGFLVAIGLVLFLLFFSRFVHRLRPVAVAALAGQIASRMVKTVIQVAETGTQAAEITDDRPALTLGSPRDGAIQAVNVRGLIRWATRNDSVLAMQAAVGDFVTAGQPVIAVFGDDAATAGHRHLRGMIALGVERTAEQDPAFAIRIMVDVAIKALSAAINDPTTAIQSIDHLARVLGRLGSIELHGRLTFRDADGKPRLFMPGRKWEHYLTLAVTEIREFGASDIQVMRRLKALLEDLRESVRPENRPAVDHEMARLEGTVTAAFGDSVDLDRARAADYQGIGGPGRPWRPAGASRAQNGDLPDE